MLKVAILLAAINAVLMSQSFYNWEFEKQENNLTSQSENFGYYEKPVFEGYIVPKPAFEDRRKTLYTFNPSEFIIEFTNQNNYILEKAAIRCAKNALPHRNFEPDYQYVLLKKLSVDVKDVNAKLIHAVDESYELIIDFTGGFLTANTIWGALRGLETFSQMVYRPYDKRHYYIHESGIRDHPRFPYRGFLVDTSRHFLDLPFIFKHLDAMSYAKLNVMHWHIVDQQSFPYISAKFPELHTNGAFDPLTHVYSRNDVRKVINYAYERGIRIVPEFDTPGHSNSWRGKKDLLTPCYDASGKIISYGAINPILEQNYQFLKIFFEEAKELFGDDTVHLGGDEVDFWCWSTNKDINTFMKIHGFEGDYAKLQNYYFDQLYLKIQGIYKYFVVWQEVFETNPKNMSKNIIINVWTRNGQNKVTIDAVSNGYKVISAACYYLDVKVPKYSWKNIYDCDPHENIVDQKLKDLVIGGTICLWGEYVSSSNFLPYAWSYAVPAADRFWSPGDNRDYADAILRFAEHHCRLIQRGIPSERITGPNFCPEEYKF